LTQAKGKVAPPAAILIAAVMLLAGVVSAPAVSDEASNNLAAPESFAAIPDTAARSAALFSEAGKVLTDPRCVNCHPAGDRPRQGDIRRLHQPPVARGEDGFGLPAMRCPICHQAANFERAGVPGNPAWHLAPHEMSWEGKTLAQICEQIKDPAAARWKISCVTLVRILWSAGPGLPEGIAGPRPARRRERARCSTPGSRPVRSVRIN
jgi:hypothetical protein